LYLRLGNVRGIQTIFKIMSTPQKKNFKHSDVGNLCKTEHGLSGNLPSIFSVARRMQTISKTDLKLLVINDKYSERIISVVISYNSIPYLFPAVQPKRQFLPQMGRKFRTSMDYALNHLMTYSKNEAQNVYFSVLLWCGVLYHVRSKSAVT
jgi:hypothetical protein